MNAQVHRLRAGIVGLQGRSKRVSRNEAPRPFEAFDTVASAAIVTTGQGLHSKARLSQCFLLRPIQLSATFSLLWSNPRQFDGIVAGRHSCWAVVLRWEPLSRFSNYLRLAGFKKPCEPVFVFQAASGVAIAALTGLKAFNTRTRPINLSIIGRGAQRHR
jgi:hypothetical protein